MGCTSSKDLFHDKSCANNCWKQEEITRSITSHNCNDIEIDLSHFALTGETLGLGGFGMVREVQKLTAFDRGTHYAMKSMSKASILKRSSGPL